MVWRKWAQTIQWTRVPLVPRGTLQVRNPFVRQWSDPTLEQTGISVFLKRNTFDSGDLSKGPFHVFRGNLSQIC